MHAQHQKGKLRKALTVFRSHSIEDRDHELLKSCGCRTGDSGSLAGLKDGAHLERNSKKVSRNRMRVALQK